MEPLKFMKNGHETSWMDPEDFPPVVTDSDEIREDYQLFHDQTKTVVNNIVTYINNQVSRLVTLFANIQSVTGTISDSATSIPTAKAVKDFTASQETRLTTAESNISDLQNETSSLDTGLQEAENDIVALETRLTTAESNIDDLQTWTSSLDTELQEAENDIVALEIGLDEKMALSVYDPNGDVEDAGGITEYTDAKGKITINGTEYVIRIGTTGAAGYLTIVLEA